MSEADLKVLHALEPHTSEIVSIVHRDNGRKSSLQGYSSFEKSWVHMDYLTRVDGDDYVVTIGDAEMKARDITSVLHDATRYEMYATETERSQAWVTKNRRLYPVTGLFRKLYAGYVQIAPRDAFDIHETHGDLSRGIVGYTLRGGEHAILHTTGNFTEDPDFFLRAIRGVSLGSRIDEKTHFTDDEERQFAEVHRPIIGKLEQLIQRDGLPAAVALAQYADQYEATGDISRHIAITLDINAQMDPVTKTKSMFAIYHLGEGNHLMIEKSGNKKRSSIKVTHEYVNNGETVTRTYEQPWIYPNMLVADVPSKGFANFDYHDKRLFALNQNDALDLSALVTSL